MCRLRIRRRQTMLKKQVGNVRATGLPLGRVGRHDEVSYEQGQCHRLRRSGVHLVVQPGAERMRVKADQRVQHVQGGALGRLASPRRIAMEKRSGRRPPLAPASRWSTVESLAGSNVSGGDSGASKCTAADMAKRLQRMHSHHDRFSCSQAQHGRRALRPARRRHAGRSWKPAFPQCADGRP